MWGWGVGGAAVSSGSRGGLRVGGGAVSSESRGGLGGGGGEAVSRGGQGGWGEAVLRGGLGGQYQEEGGGGGGISCTLNTGGGLLCVFLFNFACSFPPPTCLEVMHQVILMNPRHFAGVEELVELIHAQGPSLGILMGPDLLPANKHGKNDAIRSVVKQETQRSTKK